jgi:hemolysin III
LAAYKTDEFANAVTHGLGLILSLAAGVVLLRAAAAETGWQYAATAIYAATMVSVYAASTISHIVQRPKARNFFRMLDQGCIYLFIVGTFTPVAATYLQNGSWWMLPAAMWAIAGLGFIGKLFFGHRIDNASVVIPVLLGWMPLIGGPAMLHLVPATVFIWMLAGGVCYTLGTLFLISDHRHPLIHSVWHLWVIAGTACHFWAILRYTVPQ